jgi:phosphatidylglycerophosphate synthase
MDGAHAGAGPRWSDPVLNAAPGRGVVLRFAGLLSLMSGLVVVLETALVGTLGGLAVSLALYLTIASVALWSFRRFYPHSRVGVCNGITVLRAALVSSMAAALAAPGIIVNDPMVGWMLLAIAILSLALDGVDGFFARRAGLVSAYGARFDMEVDSVFALLLAVLAFQSGKAGAWVLVLGSFRYIYVAASLFLPWLRETAPQRFAGKVVCVVQIGVLIALLAPFVDGWPALGLAAVATAGLVWSFSVDIVWLYRNRR